MSIKTITTTLALSFLTAVSFAGGHDKINIDELSSTLDSHKVTIDYLKDDSTFECVFNKGELEVLDSPPSYILHEHSYGLVNLVTDLWNKFKAVPLDIVMAFPKEVIRDSLDELRNEGIYLSDRNWLLETDDLKLFWEVEQLVDETTGKCNVGDLKDTYGKKIEIDDDRAREFLQKINQ